MLRLLYMLGVLLWSAHVVMFPGWLLYAHAQNYDGVAFARSAPIWNPPAAHDLRRGGWEPARAPTSIKVDFITAVMRWSAGVAVLGLMAGVVHYSLSPGRPDRMVRVMFHISFALLVGVLCCLLFVGSKPPWVPAMPYVLGFLGVAVLVGACTGWFWPRAPVEQPALATEVIAAGSTPQPLEYQPASAQRRSRPVLPFLLGFVATILVVWFLGQVAAPLRGPEQRLPPSPELFDFRPEYTYRYAARASLVTGLALLALAWTAFAGLWRRAPHIRPFLESFVLWATLAGLFKIGLVRFVMSLAS